jgi:DNA transformation protein
VATSKSTIDYLLDQLSSLPTVRSRRMFGEYALYCDEKVVALVCDSQLFVKVTPAGRELVGSLYEEGEAYPGARPSMLIGAEFIDNSDKLCALIRATADALPAPKPRKPSTKRKRSR